MKKTGFSAALKIAQIIEEHSAREINSAITILRKHGYEESLLDFLSSNYNSNLSRPPKNSTQQTTKTKPIDQVTSISVLRLEKLDPERYRILLDFDKMVRQSKILGSNESLKRFGEAISKDFQARSSRKDNITSLMSILSSFEINELKIILERALDNWGGDRSNEYKNLASFLIKGR